jgi:hypothetical protein
MAATLSNLVTLLSSIAHQLAERVRAVARIASRERPADLDAARLFELEGCRAQLRVLADEQASLRRVAVLVAAGAASADVFAAIAREVAHVLRPRLVQIFRWERDGSVTVVGTWGTDRTLSPPAPTGRGKILRSSR